MIFLRETTPACPAWGEGPKIARCSIRAQSRDGDRSGALCAASYCQRGRHGTSSDFRPNDTQPANRCTTLTHGLARASKSSTLIVRSLRHSALVQGGSGGRASPAFCQGACRLAHLPPAMPRTAISRRARQRGSFKEAPNDVCCCAHYLPSSARCGAYLRARKCNRSYSLCVGEEGHPRMDAISP